MGSKFYIFAGGGTGGHLYPGLAVAEELIRLEGEAKIVFACSDRAIDRRILDPQPYAVIPQPVRPLPRGLPELPGFLKAWFSSMAQAREMVGDLRPAGVLGLGGFAAGPMVRRAAAKGIRTAFLNPDAVPGKANQYLARHVEAIFTQFESTRRHFPPRLQGKVRPVGCPIRTSLLGADRAEAIRHFELDAARKTLLVFGASLGAASINEAIIALAADLEALAEPWQVIHVSGPEKLKEVAAAWRSRPIAVKAVEYCNRMDLAYAAADLALCRSGAGTVAELAATATPAILMPYPYHKDQQQRHNAAPLASSGAAVLCEDTKDPSSNAQALREVLLPLLKDPPRLETMRQAARGLAKPRAAQDVAKWLVGVETNP